MSEAPNLPAGFTDTFTTRFIDACGLRQHVVIGGEGPPLLLVHGWPENWFAWRLLVHGWPENWYAWRLLMPALARDYTVIRA